ncbi:MAG: hypothetical protein K5867_03775, partial [Bacteroidales bacterium]|nr:hypothetical protein [Bacteroidales bacterium]
NLYPRTPFCPHYPPSTYPLCRPKSTSAQENFWTLIPQNTNLCYICTTALHLVVESTGGLFYIFIRCGLLFSLYLCKKSSTMVNPITCPFCENPKSFFSTAITLPSGIAIQHYQCKSCSKSMSINLSQDEKIRELENKVEELEKAIINDSDKMKFKLSKQLGVDSNQ